VSAVSPSDTALAFVSGSVLAPQEPTSGPTELRPSVALRDAVVVLGSFPALSGCSLTVRPGEVALLRGPNGSGKTTVLKVCAGLVPLTAGRVVILGRDLDKHTGRNRRAIRADVGFLSHAGFLYDDLTVADNVKFAIRASGGDPSAAVAAMERVGIDARVAALPVHACSAGQRRRASLAGVVARAPKLWLLDEPHTGLDADSRDLLDVFIREAATAGSTVLLASHDDDRAAALATRTLHLSGGHVVHETMGTATYGTAAVGTNPGAQP
jgi:heme ABC exporter ATP-binding subunit CcmA